MGTHGVRAEISSTALRGNIEAIRSRCRPGTPICVAVKADAYGHGIDPVLPALQEANIEHLGVANLEEGLDLRRRGWSGPILCLGPERVVSAETDDGERAREAIAADIRCTITTTREARLLAQAAADVGRCAGVEVQIDTGITRFGSSLDESTTLLNEAANDPRLTIEGVYTHFASSDGADLAFTHEQMGRFDDFVRWIRQAGIPVRRLHVANSAAIFRLPESHLDMVRPGLAVYGYWGGPSNERPQDLQPVMRVVACLDQVRCVPAGTSVGYGSTWCASRESLIGVLPIGYADGYRRVHSNDAVVSVTDDQGNRRTVPVVGRVSMDQVTVDLTDVPSVKVGDEVILIDNDPAAPNSVEALAARLDTIPYEITTLMGPRIARTAVD